MSEEKVYCGKCKYFFWKDYAGTIHNACEHPDNYEYTDTPIARMYTSIDTAEKINANNDCAWFEHKQSWLDARAKVEEELRSRDLPWWKRWWGRFRKWFNVRTNSPGPGGPMSGEKGVHFP